MTPTLTNVRFAAVACSLLGVTAAAEGHAEVVKLLLARRADPGVSSTATAKPERRTPGGMTALLFAARQGEHETVRALLDGRANIDQAGPDGMSPLLIAVLNGHYDVATLLVERGADPNVADVNGRTPLYAAIDLRNVQWSQGPAPELPQSQHFAMIERLLAAGADPSIQIAGKIGHRGSFDMRWTDLKGVIEWAQGIAANEGQPPRPQPETEKLLRELMAKQGIAIAMAR